MITFFGHLAIYAALVTAVIGSCAALGAASLGVEHPQRWARTAAQAVFALVAVAVVLIEYALVQHDFSIKFVAEVGAREVPLYFTIISLWGGLQGSILFWALLLSGFALAFSVFGKRVEPGIKLVATGLLLGILTFFLLVLAGPADPFAVLSPAPADGQGLNPLLQNHWMMGVHPVLLYLGYVGLSVPFAVAGASLLRGVPDAPALRVIRKWALIPWVFLSLGIVAGMWWSYAVLGWGGYWAWDPVENVSLMPWLVTTAFLHSLQVQERRGMLKAWTLSLITAAFLLSVLGTFLTRSGVLSSVHSFTASGVGPYYLAFLAFVLVGSVGLILARSRELAAPGALDASICRESAFMVNNLLLVAITFTVLLGTLFPLIAEAIQGSQLSVGAPYYNRIAVPIGVALLFLMGVGPALPWGATRFEQLQYRLLTPVAVGAAAILLLMLIGVRGVGALLTIGLAAFALAVTLQRMAGDAAVRRKNAHEGRSTATWKLVRSNPRRYGGYLAHIGVLLVVVGIACSQAYAVQTSQTVRRGQSVHVDGYTVQFRGWSGKPESNRMVFGAVTDVWRGSQHLGTMVPSQNIYPGGQTVPTPAVREEPFDLLMGVFQGASPVNDLGQILRRNNPFEDLYLVLQAYDSVGHNINDPRSTATLQVIVNPLVGAIWIGGFVTALGGILALMPARRRRAPVEVEERVRIVPEPTEVRA